MGGQRNKTQCYERRDIERKHAYKSSEIDREEAKGILTVEGFISDMDQS